LAQNIGEQTGAEKVLRAEVRQRRAEPHAERGGTLAIVGSLVFYLRERGTYEGMLTATAPQRISRRLWGTWGEAGGTGMLRTS
jgi:hypothetical protein